MLYTCAAHRTSMHVVQACHQLASRPGAFKAALPYSPTSTNNAPGMECRRVLAAYCPAGTGGSMCVEPTGYMWIDCTQVQEMVPADVVQQDNNSTPGGEG